MKAAFMITFLCLFILLMTGGLSFSMQNNDEKQTKSLIDRITSPDAQVRHEACREIIDTRSANIKDLLTVLNSPLAKNDNFYRWDTPRNIAIAVLGEMRDPGTVEPLLEWIVPHEGQSTETTGDLLDPFAVTALIKIGKLASVECLRRLSLKDNDKEVASLVKRGLLLRIIRQVEGDDVARFMLQNAIEKEQDKDKKANLTAALALLEKRIKQEAELNKPPENPTPPSDSGTTPAP